MVDAPSKNPEDFSQGKWSIDPSYAVSLSLCLSLSSRHPLCSYSSRIVGSTLGARDIPSVAIDDRSRAIMQLIDKRGKGRKKKKIEDPGENDREERPWSFMNYSYSFETVEERGVEECIIVSSV